MDWIVHEKTVSFSISFIFRREGSGGGGGGEDAGEMVPWLRASTSCSCWKFGSQHLILSSQPSESPAPRGQIWLPQDSALLQIPSTHKLIRKISFERDRGKAWMKPKPVTFECPSGGNQRGHARGGKSTLNVATSTWGLSTSCVFLRQFAWYYRFLLKSAYWSMLGENWIIMFIGLCAERFIFGYYCSVTLCSLSWSWTSYLRFPSVAIRGTNHQVRTWSLSIKVTDRIQALLLTLQHELLRERATDWGQALCHCSVPLGQVCHLFWRNLDEDAELQKKLSEIPPSLSQRARTLAHGVHCLRLHHIYELRMAHGPCGKSTAFPQSTPETEPKYSPYAPHDTNRH